MSVSHRDTGTTTRRAEFASTSDGISSTSSASSSTSSTVAAEPIVGAVTVAAGRRRRAVTDVADSNPEKSDLQLGELFAELTLDMCRKVCFFEVLFFFFFLFLNVPPETFCLSCPECVTRQQRIDRPLFDTRRALVSTIVSAIDRSVVAERATGSPLCLCCCDCPTLCERNCGSRCWARAICGARVRACTRACSAFSSDQSKRIVRDVGRTFPAHPLFDDGAPGQWRCSTCCAPTRSSTRSSATRKACRSLSAF
jgi:hypothetical protein